MSRLLSLLKAAAGETSLSTALGRWMQAVTASLVSVAEGGYSIAVLSGGIISVNGGGPQDLPLDDAVAGEGLDYNAGTGVWSLKAGKLYSLEFFGNWQNFNATTDSVVTQFVNSNTNGVLVNLGSAPNTARPMTGTTNATGLSTFKTLYRPTVDTGVKLRVTQIAGSADLSVGSYAIVRQIG